MHICRITLKLCTVRSPSRIGPKQGHRGANRAENSQEGLDWKGGTQLGKCVLSKYTLHWSAASPGTFSLHRFSETQKNLHSRLGARFSIPGPDERVFPSPRPLTEKMEPRFYFSPNAPHLQKCVWESSQRTHLFCSHQEVVGTLEFSLSCSPLSSVKWQTSFISLMPQYPFNLQSVRDYEHLNGIKGSLWSPRGLFSTTRTRKSLQGQVCIEMPGWKRDLWARVWSVGSSESAGFTAFGFERDGQRSRAS